MEKAVIVYQRRSSFVTRMIMLLFRALKSFTRYSAVEREAAHFTHPTMILVILGIDY